MKVIDSLNSMLGRMTPRERRLFAILVGSVGVAMVIAAWLATAAFFGSIQEDIDHGRQVLAELRQAAPRYQELAEAKRQLEDAIRANKSSVRVTANEILKKIELAEDVPGATGNRLSDIVSFEGKTTDTPVETGKGGAKKSAKPAKGKAPVAGQMMQVEQNLEFREVPVENIMSFLSTVEQGKDLLFVTKIDLARKFNDLSHVRGTVSIATYVFQGEGGGGGEGAAGAVTE